MPHEIRYTLRSYAPGAQQPAHEHDFSSISIILAGAVAEIVGGTEVIARAGEALLKPAGVRHANIYGARGTTILAVTGLVDRAVAPQEWRRVQSNLIIPCVSKLFRKLRDTDGSGVEDVWDLLATLESSGVRKKGDPPKWITDARAAVEQSNGDYSVSDQANAAGVHPVYLARVHRAWFGESIRDFAKRIRMVRAVELLVHSEKPVAKVAAETGFSDQSHMCRTFAQTNFLSPSRFRSLVAEVRGEGQTGIEGQYRAGNLPSSAEAVPDST